ncbi:hypothetical protein ACQPXS_46630 (plasmid) [Streptomyces sp. CA-142005]|uniref:hypothetical protein n=1 Tax=Streptomyces sp. CA-142005 TaxID=3240052 RepID=UPI003D8B22E9
MDFIKVLSAAYRAEQLATTGPSPADTVAVELNSYLPSLLAVTEGGPALTTDNDSYAHVLEHLHARGAFLTYLPVAGDAP